MELYYRHRFEGITHFPTLYFFLPLRCFCLIKKNIFSLSNVVFCSVLILTSSLLKCHQSSRANLNRIQGTDEAALFSRESEETTSHSGMDASKSCRFHPSNYQILSQTTEISLNSAQASEYEDAVSGACIVHELLINHSPELKSLLGYIYHCFNNVLLVNIISFAEYGNRESNVFHSFLGLQRSNMESTSREPCDPNYPAPLSGRLLITFP